MSSTREELAEPGGAGVGLEERVAGVGAGFPGVAADLLPGVNAGFELGAGVATCFAAGDCPVLDF
jgi:hypothetical protein